MQEVTRGICRRAAEKMEIQGQPGTSGADGWSLRWVSHNMKTRLRDRYCHRELVPKVACYQFLVLLAKQNKCVLSNFF